ncbi:MAG: DUF305 domain-containing protein [bacterium]
MKLVPFAAAAIAGALVLAACGNSSGHSADHSSAMSGMNMSSAATAATPASATPAASEPHNSQDISFATAMIPHHGQALTMAEMALSKTTNPNVKTLAAAIKTAQGPEIRTMSGWLTGWGQPVPSTTMPMDHGGMSMPGMMSDKDMAALDKAIGRAFDTLWLTQMIIHHRGAITMAKTELASGQNPAAKQLADSIIANQSAEISGMAQLLAAL